MINNYLADITKMVSDVIDVPVEKLAPHADFFNDLSVDSLKAIEIVAAFERKYRVIIPESDIVKIRNISQIAAYLNKP